MTMRSNRVYEGLKYSSRITSVGLAKILSSKNTV